MLLDASRDFAQRIRSNEKNAASHLVYVAGAREDGRGEEAQVPHREVGRALDLDGVVLHAHAHAPGRIIARAGRGEVPRKPQPRCAVRGHASHDPEGVWKDCVCCLFFLCAS